MITLCSPGWVNFIEIMYPDSLAHLSTAKSPQQMFGALAKTYYPEKAGIDAKDIVGFDHALYGEEKLRRPGRK